MAYDVAIVGSGFSAIAEAINLLDLLPPSASIAVVGDDPGFGRGTAYRTELNAHRLNVPAGRMSLWPDRPGDFVEWLKNNDRDIGADGFASRGDFGLYLRDTLAGLLRDREKRAPLSFIRAKAEVCDHCTSGKVSFQLDNGQTMSARAVVLCLGVRNAPLPVEPDVPDAGDRLVRNPWRLGWISQVAPDDSICILGSGLTMVDQVLALREHGHRGDIHVLSRRGLIPHAHAPHAPPEESEPDLSRGLSGLLLDFRRQVRSGVEWRVIMDGLRPATQRLWQRLSRDQRSRFLRHGLAWWNIHRHRLAPEVAQTFGALVADGTIRVHRGFLKGINPQANHVVVRYRRRASDAVDTLTTDWLVNCTGMERAGIAHSPLLKEMMGKRLIGADSLGLGLCVDRHSRVLDPNGIAQPGLYAVGALTAGQFWEVTAVPDIRVQVRDVARQIADGFAK